MRATSTPSPANFAGSNLSVMIARVVNFAKPASGHAVLAKIQYLFCLSPLAPSLVHLARLLL